MKKILFLLLAAVLISGTAYAKPEQLRVKSENRRVKEKAARNQLKAVQLNAIEDPEARKAIREILNYLDLSYQK